MSRLKKVEIGIAGVCVAALGTTAAASLFSDNTMETDIVYSESDNFSAEEMTLQSGGNCAETEITISFTAVPNYELSSENMLVFLSENPYMIVNVPVTESYPLGENVSVSGILSGTDGYTITLGKCIVNAKPQNQTEKAEISVSAPTLNGITVYVSESGKYHTKPDCSGMKSYKEMTVTEAQNSGFTSCKRCN